MGKKGIISIIVAALLIVAVVVGAMFMSKDSNDLDGATGEIEKEQEQIEKEEQKEREEKEEAGIIEINEGFESVGQIDVVRASARYYVDTEGFYDFNGVKMGYPQVAPAGIETKEKMLGIQTFVLVDRDVKVEDAEEFHEEIDSVKINGEGISEYIKEFFKDDIEYAQEEGEEYLYKKGDVIGVQYDVPYDELVEEKDEVVDELEDGISSIYLYFYFDGYGNHEKFTIDFNGIELDIPDQEEEGEKTSLYIEFKPDIIEE